MRIMKRNSTLFLKVVILLMAVSALAGMIWFPQTEGRATGLDLISIYTDPFILYMYIASIPFFMALQQSFAFLGLVDRNKIFSQSAVKTVERVKYCAVALIVFITAAALYISVLSKSTNEDGAGAIMIGIILIFASSVIATATAVFQKILQNAVDMKSENDLTV